MLLYLGGGGFPHYTAFNFTFKLPTELYNLFSFCMVLCSCKWVAIVWSAEVVLYLGSADCLLPLYSLSSFQRWLPLLLSDFVSPCIVMKHVIGWCFSSCALSGIVNAGGSFDSCSSLEEGQTSSTKVPLSSILVAKSLHLGVEFYSHLFLQGNWIKPVWPAWQEEY